MYELATRSSKHIAAPATALTLIAGLTTDVQAETARSSVSVMVQVINPCEVTFAPDGSWIAFGCEGASFDFSTFSTATVPPVTVNAVSTSLVSEVEYMNVTY